MDEGKAAGEPTPELEQDFRLMFEAAAVGMAQIDPYTFRFLRVNRRLAEMTGYTTEELLGMSALEITHPDDRGHNRALWEKTLSGEMPEFAIEKRYVRKDGGVIRVSVAATLLRDAEGRPLRTISTIQDITERERAGEALRQAEQRARALIENLPGGAVFVVDRGLRYLIAEGEALAAAGFEPAHFIGRTLFEALPLELAARYEPHYRSALAGKAFEFEHDSHGRSYLTRGGPLYSADGEIYAALAVSNDITERKKAEKALRESEERKSFLLRLSDSLRPLSDAVEVQATVTRTALNYFGADRCYYCEIEGGDAVIRRDASREGLTSVAGVYPLDSLPVFKAVVDAGRPFVVVDSNTSELIDEPLRRLCSQMEILSFIDVPVMKNGKPVGILCITQCTPRNWTDLEVELAVEVAERTWAAVERARAEGALRASEGRLRRMVNVPRVGVLTFDHTGVIIHANDAFLEMVGYERGEFEARGFTWRDLTPPEHVEVTERTLQSLLESGRGGPYEKEYLRKDGTRLWLMLVAADLGDGTIVEYAVDVSERKRAEAALWESRERLALTLEAGSLGIWDSDLLTHRTYWSPEQERLFGQEPGSFDGGFGERLHPDDRERVLRRLAEVRVSGGDYEDEYRVVWPDGTVRWLAARGRVYRDPQGLAVRILGVNFDVTRRKEAEERLRASEARLQALVETQKRFVADASHELRAPLMAIQGNLELVCRFPQLPESERQAALEDARGEANRMARLVNDMLALAKGDAGVRLRLEPLDLSEVLREALAEARRLARGHVLEAGLPERLEIRGDRDRLKQLALILLENALRYTPEGGEVRLGLALDGGWAELRVSDTGIGIAPEDLPYVFERFWRADPARSRAAGGTGLGLSIAKWVVEQHGGEIRLESEVGRGTTAIVRLWTGVGEGSGRP